MSLDIFAGSVRFSSLTDSGFLIGKAGLKGWHSGVAVRRDQKDRPLAPGSFDTQAYFDSRLITISGYCLANSPQKLRLFQSQLLGLFAAGGQGQLVVKEDGVSQHCTVRQAGQTEFDAMNDGVTATYQVQLWAADPFKYGDTTVYAAPASTPLTVTAWHYGNYSAYPVLTITGTMPSYSVSSGGKTFQVSMAVTPGHPHYIHMDSGLLVVDGFPVYGVVVQGGIWTIPPGQQISQTLAPAGGTGAMTVTVTDTSI
jgi:hypothetical protein